MIGTATRFVSGATRLTLPNTAATRGAVNSVATTDVSTLRYSVPCQPRVASHRHRRPSAPAATSATIPTALS